MADIKEPVSEDDVAKETSTNSLDERGDNVSEVGHNRNHVSSDMNGSLTERDKDREFPEKIKEREGRPAVVSGMPSINLNELTVILRDPSMPSHKIMNEVADKMMLRSEESESEDGSIGSSGGVVKMSGLLDCIFEVTYQQTSSNNSDDDDEDCFEKIKREIPCNFCNKIFGSTMTWKTHVLVAHQDPSVLNIKPFSNDEKDKEDKAHTSHARRRRHAKLSKSEVDMNKAQTYASRKVGVKDAQSCHIKTNVHVERAQRCNASTNVAVEGVQSCPSSTNVVVEGVQSCPASTNVAVEGVQSCPASTNVAVEGVQSCPSSTNVVVEGVQSCPASTNVAVEGVQSCLVSTNVAIEGDQTYQISKRGDVNKIETCQQLKSDPTQDSKPFDERENMPSDSRHSPYSISPNIGSTEGYPCTNPERKVSSPTHKQENSLKDSFNDQKLFNSNEVSLDTQSKIIEPTDSCFVNDSVYTNLTCLQAEDRIVKSPETCILEVQDSGKVSQGDVSCRVEENVIEERIEDSSNLMGPSTTSIDVSADVTERRKRKAVSPLSELTLSNPSLSSPTPSSSSSDRKRSKKESTNESDAKCT